MLALSPSNNPGGSKKQKPSKKCCWTWLSDYSLQKFPGNQLAFFCFETGFSAALTPWERYCCPSGLQSEQAGFLAVPNGEVLEVDFWTLGKELRQFQNLTAESQTTYMIRTKCFDY